MQYMNCLPHNAKKNAPIWRKGSKKAPNIENKKLLDSLGRGMGDGLLLPTPPAGACAWNQVSKNNKISEKSPLFAYCLAPNFLLIYRESFSINLATYLGYVFISYITINQLYPTE